LHPAAEQNVLLHLGKLVAEEKVKTDNEQCLSESRFIRVVSPL
jgi:hypothetical protein